MRRHDDIFARADRNQRIFSRVFFSIFGVVVLFFIAYFAFLGFAAYSVVTNPDGIGHEIGRALGSFQQGIEQGREGR